MNHNGGVVHLFFSEAVSEAEKLGRAWREQAACAEYPVSTFFPEPDAGNVAPDFAPALAVCRGCEVLTQCRNWAETAGEIKGGHAMHGQVVGGCRPKAKGDVGRPPTKGHGTRDGYRQHRVDGTRPCRACLAAKTEHRYIYPHPEGRRRA